MGRVVIDKNKKHLELNTEKRLTKSPGNKMAN